MSGFGTDEDIQRSLRAGFAEHLTKPLHLDQFGSSASATHPRLEAIFHSPSQFPQHRERVPFDPR